MLYSIDDPHKPIGYIPHEKEYRIWRSRLSETEFQAIVDKLNSMVDSDEVHTSSWMPGHDWTGTVFQPIWGVACLKNDEAAAKCFGLILWEAMMNRAEDWSFGRFEKNSIPIEGLTYYRIHR